MPSGLRRSKQCIQTRDARHRLRHYEADPTGTDTPIIYEGKGLITQIDNDHLNYKLFATHAKNIDPGAEMMRMFNGTSGKVIEADQYYDLTANDVHGQVWTSEHIQPNSIWPQDDLPVLHGGLRYISAATTSRIPHNSVSIECFKALDFPTRFGRQIARAPVEDTFKVGSIEFSTRQSDEGFQISAVSDQPLDENYYLRIIEALKFVTARPVLPRIITHITGDKATVYFSAAICRRCDDVRDSFAISQTTAVRPPCRNASSQQPRMVSSSLASKNTTRSSLRPACASAGVNRSAWL